MKYRSFIFMFWSLVISTGLMAQTAEDALRFSGNSQTGTARFMGLSGAMGSVGGDLSVINYNPAGLGIYKSSEYIFAPRYLFQSADASYAGNFSNDRRDNLNFGLIGLVSSMPIRSDINPDTPGWKFVQFGFSINRVDNYRSDILIEGPSYGGSLVNQWRDQANGSFPEDLNPFSTNLAWETYLLDTINGYPTEYTSAMPASGVNQSYRSLSEGYKNEMSFTMSGNYNDKLFIGTSLSFVFLNYYRNTTIIEEAIENPLFGEFDRFSYNEELNTRGNGFNAKFGVIYMPTPVLRFSGAIHTPTWFYRMTDTYFTKISSTMYDGYKYSQSSPNGRYEYYLNTPFRALGGASFFIRNMGFISLDYEYMDYRKAYLKSSGSSFTDENKAINADFAESHTIKIGTEWSLKPFFLRAGYAFATSPVKEEINKFTSDQFSLGVGYRSGPFFIDIAYMQRMNAQNFYMYDANYVNPAYLETTTNYVSLSLGFKFK